MNVKAAVKRNNNLKNHYYYAQSMNDDELLPWHQGILMVPFRVNLRNFLHPWHVNIWR